MTRFYFHSATNATAGLPTAEQSTLTAAVSISAQTLNRTMNTTIGTGMVSLAYNPNGTTQNVYFTRFVSLPIFQTSIAANTWTYNFSASELQSSGNFPVNGTNQPVRVNCYVWRPSTSTKIGTILDGNTASTVDEQTSGNRAHNVTFTGAAVASVQNNDVIIFEVWFIVNGSTGRTGTFFYDGTTVNTTDNATVSNHASFLETPENLDLIGNVLFERSASDSFTVGDSVVKRMRAIRPVPANTVTISGNVTRFMDIARLVSASLTISATPVKVYRTFKSIPQSLTIITNVLGEKLFARSLGENFIIIANANRSGKLARTFPVSLTISAAPVATRRVLRSVSNSFTVNAVVSKFKRFVRTASNSLTIADNVLRDLTVRRTIAEPVVIVANVVKSARKSRAANNTLTIAANVARVKRVLMTVNNSITIIGNVVGKKIIHTFINESLTVGATVVRRLRAIRPLAIPITIAITLDARMLVLIQRTVNNSLTISANVARLRRVPRLVIQSISVATQAIEKLCSAYD